jgi:hypothetical protein
LCGTVFFKIFRNNMYSYQTLSFSLFYVLSTNLLLQICVPYIETLSTVYTVYLVKIKLKLIYILLTYIVERDLVTIKKI